MWIENFEESRYVNVISRPNNNSQQCSNLFKYLQNFSLEVKNRHENIFQIRKYFYPVLNYCHKRLYCPYEQTLWLNSSKEGRDTVSDWRPFIASIYGNHLIQESWCFVGMFGNTGAFWEKVYIENIISGNKVCSPYFTVKILLQFPFGVFLQAI